MATGHFYIKWNKNLSIHFKYIYYFNISKMKTLIEDKITGIMLGELH